MTTIYKDKDGKTVKTDPGTRPAGASKPKGSAAKRVDTLKQPSSQSGAKAGKPKE